MKQSLILLFAMACLMTGCNQIEIQTEEERACLVSFNFVGEISSSDALLTKAPTDDLYLVQVYQNGSFYGTGVFDSIDKIQIFLKAGYSYKFVFNVVRNGKEQLGNYYSSVNNSILPIGTFYSCLNNNGMWWAINYYYYKSIDLIYYYSGKTSTELGVYYNHNFFDMNLDCSHASLSEYDGQYAQCDDWFYGVINNYSPNGEFETLSVNLKRVGFKLKYELSGVTDGEVTVKIYKKDDNQKIIRTFIDNTTSTPTYASDPFFYAFYDVSSAWQYAEDYMENMTLAVSWKRGVGVTEDYGTKTIQIKRNCLNNIKIQMTSADQQAGMNMTVESESTIGTAAVTIPVE